MKITRYLIDLAKNVALSRVAQVFFAIQLIFLTIALIKRGDLFSPPHPEYEPAILNILAVINIPSTIITMILFFPIVLLLILIGLEKNLTLSNFAIISMYISWQMQAALIGYGIEKLFRRKKEILA